MLSFRDTFVQEKCKNVQPLFLREIKMLLNFLRLLNEIAVSRNARVKHSNVKTVELIFKLWLSIIDDIAMLTA